MASSAVSVGGSSERGAVGRGRVWAVDARSVPDYIAAYVLGIAAANTFLGRCTQALKKASRPLRDGGGLHESCPQPLGTVRLFGDRGTTTLTS